MKIDSRDLHGLPVFTESGSLLGKVLGFDLDVDSHSVRLYHVGARNWPRPASTFEISPGQVVSITAERMTVKDAVEAEAGTVRQAVNKPVTNVSPIATRQE